MKRNVCIILLAIVVVSSITCYIAKSKNNDNQVTLNVYNWGEFISDGSDGSLDVNKEFTRLTGIKVNYSTFQNNESLFAKIKNGGTKYDVIIPSDYMISKMIENDMLAKIDFSKISNKVYIDKTFENPVYDPKNEYSVPYVWGTVGIIYNEKYVKEKEHEIDWNIFWNEKYKNKILMFDNPRDSFAISQFALNLSVNSLNEDNWEKAAEKLKQQKPLVQAYVMDQIFDKMGNEEAYLAPYYAGDAMNLVKKNKNLKFTIPKSGTTKFVDAMCIPKNCEHFDEALKYIDFMCTPRVSKANSEKTGYFSPEETVRSSRELLPEETKIQKQIEYFETNLQVFNNLPDVLNKKVEDLWVVIKVGKEGKMSDLILAILLLLTIYVLIVICRKMKNKNRHCI